MVYQINKNTFISSDDEESPIDENTLFIRGGTNELFHICSVAPSPFGFTYYIVGEVKFDGIVSQGYYCSSCSEELEDRFVFEDGKGTGYEGHG